MAILVIRESLNSKVCGLPWVTRKVSEKTKQKQENNYIFLYFWVPKTNCVGINNEDSKSLPNKMTLQGSIRAEKCKCIFCIKWPDRYINAVKAINCAQWSGSVHMTCLSKKKKKKRATCAKTSHYALICFASMYLLCPSLWEHNAVWLFSQLCTFKKISPSLQSIYQVARSCQAVVWQQTHEWLIAVWGA